MKTASDLRLILVDRGRDFFEVLRWQFREHPEVEIVCGKFEDLPAFDCVITAGTRLASWMKAWTWRWSAILAPR